MPETNTEADRDAAAGRIAAIRERLVNLCTQMVADAVTDLIDRLLLHKVPDTVAVAVFRLLEKRARSCADQLEAELKGRRDDE
jgi:hypothetical protein